MKNGTLDVLKVKYAKWRDMEIMRKYGVFNNEIQRKQSFYDFNYIVIHIPKIIVNLFYNITKLINVNCELEKKTL